jgi:tyrosine-protein phosphatase
MWCFSIRHLGDRPRYACCLSPFTLGSPTSLGPQRIAWRLCICETKKYLREPKYVVSTATYVPAPRDLIPRFRLIYQLFDYEKAHFLSPTPSDRSQSDEEWNRRRKLLDEAEDHDDAPNKEARALDKVMEDRVLARKKTSSMTGSSRSMGPAWKFRYSARKRTASVASNMTGNDDGEIGAATNHYSHVPPSARRSSFKLSPAPTTAFKSTFDTSHRPISKTRRRPTPLDILPTVPDSPVNAVATPTASTALAIPRTRKESRATPPVSLSLRKSSQPTQQPSQAPSIHKPVLQTPSQTLFVFPPSPTLSACIPSAMTLTSNPVSVPFPSSVTPRSKSDARRRSLIGLMMPSTPTTAHARVDARGWVGIH